MNFSHWAVVGYKDDTGIGRLAKDMKTVLGLGRHLFSPSARLKDDNLNSADQWLLSPRASDDELKQLFADLEGIIFFERPDWHPRLLAVAKSLGLCTVCVPMWEWFAAWDKAWADCDLFICPTKFTLRVLQSLNFRNSIYLPVPLNLSQFPARAIKGKARRFVHNGGLVDNDDRKGTRLTIKAFSRLRHADIKLLVRLQKEVPLPPLDSRITVEFGNLEQVESLYDDCDVAIQPSSMEGLGLMVIEPWLSGLPVITTNYPPMNEFVQSGELLVSTRWFKRPAYSSRWMRQAHLKLPDAADLARKIEWCALNNLDDISRSNRQAGEKLFDADQLKALWQRALQDIEQSS